MKYNVLYNPYARNGAGINSANDFVDKLPEGSESQLHDLTLIDDYDRFISNIPADEEIYLVGGDGTLNYFVNNTLEETRSRKIGYYAGGTGNDFFNDLNLSSTSSIDNISPYITNLPTVVFNGEKRLFINGVGYGIDGYVCEEVNRKRAFSDKPVSYTKIAIKGLLFDFKPRKATLTIDGETFESKNTWLAPAMKGRFFGGGMMATPGQDRNDPDKKLSVLTFACKLPLRALFVFPSVFKGNHVKSKACKVYTGNEITVSFDRPCALQIDGETFTDVASYKVYTD